MKKCEEMLTKRLGFRFRQKVELVYRATKKHAMNLARFATIYKLTILALKYYGPTPGKEGKQNTAAPILILALDESTNG